MFVKLYFANCVGSMDLRMKRSVNEAKQRSKLSIINVSAAYIINNLLNDSMQNSKPSESFNSILVHSLAITLMAEYNESSINNLKI
jgi:hypothetical protein